MSLTPHLHVSFDGQCEAAFKFYERHLGAKIEGMFKYRGSPMADQAPPGWEDKVMHASLRIGELVIMGADVRDAKMNGFQVMLATPDVEEAERLFAALSENAVIGMPLQQTFWAVRFGVLTDQFGVPWSINCEQAPESNA